MDFARVATAARSPLDWPAVQRLAALFRDWESWLTLGLVLVPVIAVATTLESGGWSRTMPALTLVGVLAAVTGAALARSSVRMYFSWPLAFVLGALVVFWQTLEMVAPGGLWERLDAIYFRFNTWFHLAFTGGVTNDPLPFNVLALGVTWIGVFFFAWSVFRWHNAWIGLIPGAAALFINMVFIGDSLSMAAIVYVLFGFLLVMRTNLMERMERWRADGVEYPPMISLSFLHLSTWALLALITAAWIAPVGPFSTPGPVKSGVSAAMTLGDQFVRLAGPLHVSGSSVTPAHGYTGVLPFQGSISLGDRELMQVRLQDSTVAGPIIMRGAVYDEYATGGWRAGDRETVPLPGGLDLHVEDALRENAVDGRLITIDVEVERRSVIGTVMFTPGSPVSASRGATIETPAGSTYWIRIPLPDRGISLSDEQIFEIYLPEGLTGLSVERDNDFQVQRIRVIEEETQVLPDALVVDPGGRIPEGESYRATGFVPSVTPDELRAASTDYPDWVLDQYITLPGNTPGRVIQLSHELTAGAVAYDAAKNVEDYLRINYPVDYAVGDTPPGADTVDHFLFELHRGYFDYHASAMVVLLRAAGVPSRMAVGFVIDEDDFDVASRSYTVRDRNAYAWPEVYFPGYGWIPFNPTPDRPADLSPSVRDQAPELPPGLTLDDIENLPVAADGLSLDQPDFPIGGADFASSRAPSDGFPAWILLAAAAFAAAVAGAAWLGWRGSVAGLPYSYQLWEKSVRLASLAGHPPRPGQTPLEFADTLRRRLKGVRELRDLAAVYSRSRFGNQPPSPEEERRLRVIWPELRSALTGAIASRILRRRPPDRTAE